MTIITFTSRQFKQNASKVKKAAAAGPVFITVRGRPAHVLLTFDEYKKLTRKQSKIADLLAMPDMEHVDFDIPAMRDLAHSPNLS